jgi:hypothetical protein
MGAQHEHHVRNPHRVGGGGGDSDQEGHGHAPKGLGAKASRSGARDMQQLPHFWAPKDFVRYTTKELLGIATYHATREEVVKPLPVPVPGSSRAAPSGVAVHGTKKVSKGGKKV